MKNVGPSGQLSRFVAVAAILVGVGAAMRAWESVAWARPRLRLQDDFLASARANGQGLSVAALGGFGSALADLAWVRASVAWENSDRFATTKALHLSVALDPGVLFFWVNGARILCYDVARWRIEAAGPSGSVPVSVRARVVEEQAQEALEFLRRAERVHPGCSLLSIEAAQIHLHARRNLDQATDAFRRAAECPDAPHFVARIYAELLRRQGKLREAHRSLTIHYRSLVENGARAPIKTVSAPITEGPYRIDRAIDPIMVDIVRRRITEIARELEVSDINRVE